MKWARLHDQVGKAFVHGSALWISAGSAIILLSLVASIDAEGHAAVFEDTSPSPPVKIEFTAARERFAPGDLVVVSYKVLDGSGLPVSTVDRWVSGPGEVAEVQWSGPRALSVRALAPGTFDLWIEAVGAGGSVEGGIELEIVHGAAAPDETSGGLVAPALVLAALVPLAFISGYVIERRLESFAAGKRRTRPALRPMASRTAPLAPGRRTTSIRSRAESTLRSPDRIVCPSCDAEYGRGETQECELCGTTLISDPVDPASVTVGSPEIGCDHLDSLSEGLVNCAECGRCTHYLARTRKALYCPVCLKSKEEWA